MDKVKDLKEMASLTMEEFTQILGSRISGSYLKFSLISICVIILTSNCFKGIK